MRRMTLALLVCGLGVGSMVIAGEKHCSKGASANAAGAQQISPKLAEQLAAVPSYQRANELLKSWSEVPVKLAAMTDDSKKEISTAADKMNAHPAKAVLKPTIAYLNQSLALAVELDSAKHAIYHIGKSEGTEKAAAKANDEPACPKARSAMYRGKESAALVGKAQELILVAYTAIGGENGGAGHGACAKGAAAKLTGGGEGHVCPKAKAAAEKAAAEGDKSKVALTAGGAPGGCSKAHAAATGDGGAPCVKSLSAKADAAVAESGKLLAQWQEASAMLANMDDATRREVESACATASSKCPIGALMPETISTIRELLVRAVKLDAQTEAELAKNPEMAKHLSEEIKTLSQSRRMVTNAALNVLEKTSIIAKPAKQMASAQ